MQHNAQSTRSSFTFMLASVVTLALSAAACTSDATSESSTPAATTATAALGPNCTKYVNECCPALMAKTGQPTTTCSTAKSAYESSYGAATATQKEQMETTCGQANANGKTMGASGC